MPDINYYIMHPDNKDKSPEFLDRVQTLQGWDRDTAKNIATQEGLLLTDEHWAFIDYLQQSYLQHGWPQNSYELTQSLDSAFAEQGGKRYLYRLFPEGPIVQGSHIAGLPVPHNAKNESLGSVQ